MSKKCILALFSTQHDAEVAIVRMQKELGISPDEISYVYRTIDGHIDPASSELQSQKTTLNDTVETLAGIPSVLGVVPVVGPIVAAGPLASALGIGNVTIGTTAAGAITGAAGGGIVGALLSWGTDEATAREYEERVLSGDILIAVHSQNDTQTGLIFSEGDAFRVEIVNSGTS